MKCNILSASVAPSFTVLSAGAIRLKAKSISKKDETTTTDPTFNITTERGRKQETSHLGDSLMKRNESLLGMCFLNSMVFHKHHDQWEPLLKGGFICSAHRKSYSNSSLVEFMLERRKTFMLTNDKSMQLGAYLVFGANRVSDQVHPTVLIHLLNIGSSGQQLLDRLLQTTTSRQVERTGRDTQTVCTL